MKLDSVRQAALALPHTTEEPHHHYASFRVRGRIFITVPPEQTHIHLFLSEADREFALAAYPAAAEKLLWGSKVLGIRVALAAATPTVVKTWIKQAYEHQAAKGPARAAAAGPATQGTRASAARKGGRPGGA